MTPQEQEVYLLTKRVIALENRPQVEDPSKVYSILIQRVSAQEQSLLSLTKVVAQLTEKLATSLTVKPEKSLFDRIFGA